MERPAFKLGKRLSLCADMVREGVVLADIGTDHGYLPIWLGLRGIISKGIASDINPGPLQAAKKNIERWNAGMIATRLSDGLKEIAPHEVDDIVIAGMGGELIARIINDAPWLKDNKKHLILQPVTSVAELREFLAKEGYAILHEEAVLEDRRVYTVISATYAPEKVAVFPGYEYIGGLDGSVEVNRVYLKSQAIRLRKRAMGLRCQKKYEEADAIENVISLMIQKAEGCMKNDICL